jgi:hypothetical protein
MPYIDADDVVIGNEPVIQIRADQVEVARLKQNETEGLQGEWILSPAGGVTFANVAFEADDEEDAINKAKAWIESFFERESEQIP